MTQLAEIVLPGVCLVDNDREGKVAWMPQGGRSPFVTDEENLPVLAAMQHMLEMPRAGPYSLVLYGPTGSGKTHLLRLLWDVLRAVFPRRTVLASTAADFVRGLTTAIDQGRTEAFRRAWRAADWLLLDDIHHLQDYPAAEMELVSIFRWVERGMIRLAVTCAKAPQRLKGLSEALRSRLSGGYALPVQYPSPKARQCLLRMALAHHGLQATPAATECLLEECRGPASQILGLAASAAFFAGQGTIDLSGAKRLVKQIERPAPPTPGQILRATAQYFRLPVAELKGPSRSRRTVQARETAIYLLAVLSNKSLRQIGKILGNRDHTTISYALRKAETALENDPSLRLAVGEITEKSRMVGKRKCIS